jgi:Na+-transporting NADH:ubiquinone oxidoreductase subunit F
VLLAILLYTSVVVILAVVVLAVRRLLTLREDVVIDVNGLRQIQTRTGDTLLDTLRESGVELPATCGGRGACGKCRVVVSGAGALLPTEANHINRRDAGKGTRLACMVKVRNDLHVQVPPGVLQARRYTVRVHSNHNISTYLKELVLELADPSQFQFQAGDYVLLEAPPCSIEFSSFEIDAEYQSEWRRQQLDALVCEIRDKQVRAYSLADAPRSNRFLALVVRIALPPIGSPADIPPGLVSSYVFSLHSGDEVAMRGPFGEFHAEATENEMICIGGGAGIAPLRSIILDQLKNKRTNRTISLWYGVRSFSELCFDREFDALANEYPNFSYHGALSEPTQGDPWAGSTGFIHTVVADEYLATHPHPEAAEYYLCGPPLMSAATLTMLEDLGVDRSRIFLDDFGSQTVEEKHAD